MNLQVVPPLTIGTIRAFESRAPGYQGYVVIVDTWTPTGSLSSSSSFRGLTFSTSTLAKLGGLNENRTRPYGVTGHYTNRYTMRPNLLLLY
jgi:hypothetical protein